MTDQHSITPPPELVEQWTDAIHQLDESFDWSDLYIATQAASWGANQELEACCEWLLEHGYDLAMPELRAARRNPSRTGGVAR